MSEQQSNFEGYAILEIFGHQKYAGYVTTQTFGSASMFRLDVPALEERERMSKRAGYAGGNYYPAGATIKEGAVQGYTKLFGVGAIYAITPCTQEAALAVVEEIQPRPLMLVSLPAEKALPAAPEKPAEPISRDYICCKGNPEDGHESGCENEFADFDDDEDSEDDDGEEETADGFEVIR